MFWAGQLLIVIYMPHRFDWCGFARYGFLMGGLCLGVYYFAFLCITVYGLFVRHTYSWELVDFTLYLLVWVFCCSRTLLAGVVRTLFFCAL